MIDPKGTDTGLELLLELDGEIFPMDNGYWTKFEVKRIEPNDRVPHGIRYSLTLHDKNNVRVLGYDNAHGINRHRNRFKSKHAIWDHKHEKARVKPYLFKTAAQLLQDFWDDVNNVMNNTPRPRL